MALRELAAELLGDTRRHARGRRSGRPRGRPRRPGGRAAGTTPPRPAAARAPSRPRRRRCRSSCSSARPHDDARVRRRPARARKSHLRPLASSSVTSRSGRDAASGIPGAPPPEPTSTIGPSKPRTSSSAAQRVLEQHAPRLVGSRIAVRPGRRRRRVEPALEPRRVTSADDDDVAVRLVALARRLDARRLLQAQVDDLALDRASSARARPARRSRAPARRCRTASASSVRAAPLAVARRVDDDLLAVLGVTSPDDRVREVLDRVDRLAVPADQQPEVAARARRP